MSWSGEILKCLVLIFNLVFAVAGIVLVGLGVAACCKVEAMVKIFGGDPIVLPILTTVFGLLIFLVAFFGCCGGITESDCVLIIFSVFTIQLLIPKILLVVLFFAKSDLIEQIVRLIDNVITRNEQKTSPEFEVDSIRWGFSAVFISIVALELTATVFACCFAKHIRSRLRDGYSRASDVAMTRFY